MFVVFPVFVGENYYPLPYAVDQTGSQWYCLHCIHLASAEKTNWCIIFTPKHLNKNRARNEEFFFDDQMKINKNI